MEQETSLKLTSLRQSVMLLQPPQLQLAHACVNFPEITEYLEYWGTSELISASAKLVLTCCSTHDHLWIMAMIIRCKYLSSITRTRLV
jgi:hypothetical protein